ncbi:hypothetical protein SAMN05421682_1031 [Chryseobacterium indoltheticum]|uniref:Uncharacterized protein n=1 Tax=Chryseobacterium indoltheticum TaxID=254 RepID=A0A381FEK3_9FLAO|nr:hypothetical protein SAMN05421682_1031 [Chryseobacterium indoltheticum]SUX44979.1 Uncharacterised protein [Chryseobacterium indoltheticum]
MFTAFFVLALVSKKIKIGHDLYGINLKTWGLGKKFRQPEQKKCFIPHAS